ncbi:MAG: HEAT repeat domain-containing protein [Planctomycetota bacterium]|jgi:Mg-chelatase subunit ChlD
MRIRILLAWLALVSPLAAQDGKEEFEAAREKLEEVRFESLDRGERERLLQAIGGWDQPRAVPDVATVAARYGLFVSVLERKLPEMQKRLDPFRGRRALTEEEMSEQIKVTRELERQEMKWRSARASNDVLIQAVGAYRNPKTLKKALSDWPKHGSWHVRYLLARACAHWHLALKDTTLSNKLFATLKKLTASEEPGVRIAVARALMAFKQPRAVDLLGQLLEDKDWAVRAAAVKGLKEAGSNPAITYLIDGMMREKGRLQDDINDVLQGLTGQNFDWPESWGRWWASVGRQLPQDPQKQPRSGEAKATDTSRFYGIPTRSERICYIIDISGSMSKEVEDILKTQAPTTGKPSKEAPAEGRTRIEVAKNELKRAISNLAPSKRFNIIFFNNAVKTWRKEMTNATAKAKTAMRKEVDAVQPGGATYTLGALREAFTLAGALDPSYKLRESGARIDTIFLLSDGGPTSLPKGDEVKLMDPEIILETVRQWNRDAGIAIHCIAVDTGTGGTIFLKALAEQNGGRFVDRKN